MKKERQRTENRIGMLIVLGCVVLMAGVCVFAGGYLHRKEQAAQENTEAVEEAAVSEELTVEAGAVQAKENMLGSSFQNVSGDNRRPLRIVEVIPHPACSVFPYMVDWGSKEGYDENTFLGYEALRRFTMSAKADKVSVYNRQNTLVKEGSIRDYLTSYDVEFTNKDAWESSAGWWRGLEMDQNIPGDKSGEKVNGYFKYVGEGKGLYDINLETIVREDSEDYGIRYRIAAMERQGRDAKQGEWEVKNAQYYWAKECEGDSYPSGLDGTIHQRTEYNYDVKFQENSVNGVYRIKDVKCTPEILTGAAARNYDYAVTLAKNAVWDGGYVYSKEGNYEIDTVETVTVNENNLSDVKAGKYYKRVLNSEKADNYTNLGAGYFRMCDAGDAVKDDKVYKLTFKESERGNYVILPAAVYREIDADAVSAYKKFIFHYAGAGKGNYNVTFIYGSSEGGIQYSAEVLAVSDGDGRYAMTSTATEQNELYEWKGNHEGDYSKVITKIDCAGIDFTDYRVIRSWGAIDYYSTEGYYPESSWNALPGLNAGQDSQGGEHGSWVFCTVDSDEVNHYTKIEALENGQIPSEIYVYGQNRKKRYYVQNGISNNEWFKLLLYLSTEDGSQPIAYQDYADKTKTPLEIKDKYAAAIEAFDASYRIEIIQKTPGTLTVDDVEKADLIYFGNRITMQGMSVAKWNELLPYASHDLEPLNKSDLISDSFFMYEDDLSTEVMFALYDNCLYNCTTALIMGAWELGGTYTGEARAINNNLGKIYYLANWFDNPADFAKFMDLYPDDQEEEYTEIHSDGTVTVYPQQIQTEGIHYNQGKFYLTNDSGIKGEPIPPIHAGNVWNDLYFRVVEFDIDEMGNYKTKSEYSAGKGVYNFHWGYSSYDGCFAGQDVLDDFRTWYLPKQLTQAKDGDNSSGPFYEYSVMRNIWKILHNKKSKVSSEPVVIVTNADGDDISELSTVTPIYYFYVDAFALGGGNEDFIIDFTVNWTPEEVDEPTPLSSVTVERSEGGVIHSVSGPSYKTDYSCNVAGDFIKDGAFDASINSKEYKITAVDTAGKEDSVIVRFLVRDTFMLN